MSSLPVATTYHSFMRWLFSEYLLKGVYLGLLLFVALQEPSARTTALAAAWTLGGLGLALVIATVGMMRQGYRLRGQSGAFVLCLLLESPTLIYAGAILGLAAGALAVRTTDQAALFSQCVGGGLAVGGVFWLLRRVHHRWVRFGLSLTLAMGLVAAVLLGVQHFSLLEDVQQRTAFAIRLLLGLPLFYLLTFAGISEETEIEIGGMCAALALAIWMLTPANPASQSIGLLVAAAVYIVYTMRILPSLRVFKHVVRGISHAKFGRYVPALMEFRRALQLDSDNKLARDGLWKLHRTLPLDQLTGDPRMRELIDADMCLQRVSSLLLEAGPSTEKLAEARQLLDLVLAQRPAMEPVALYWRAVADTHDRKLDEAARELQQVLDGSRYAADDPHRLSVLAKAWQLALTLHPELNRRVGTPALGIPGRRMEAIVAVERHLAQDPSDAGIWDVKRILYSTVTEAEYAAGAGMGLGVVDFDHDYAQQLGMALIHDPARWQRGAEYLRIAARGLPAQSPSILMNIVEAQQRQGEAEHVWQTHELIKQIGQTVGPKNLSDADRHVYFAAMRACAEHAQSGGDFDTAIANYQLYTEFVGSGLETLRTIADLYERKGDILNALRMTEQALVYNAKDADLLERKDRYLYSITPDLLRSRLETARPIIDVNYCLQKSRTLLDLKNAELDLIDWAQHLAELVLVINPASVAAKVALARAKRRRGETEESRALLEEVFANRPGSFASADDEEMWYLGCRLLGETYLYETQRPDLAVPCFQAYRKSPKSGADTLYKMGQAYEQLGDRDRAIKCYDHVVAYEGHPLAPDARDALYRLKSSG